MPTATPPPIFQNISSLEEVATLLAASPKQLRYLLYGRKEEERYTTFPISKRRGGIRTIKAPRTEIKAIQRRFSGILQDFVPVRQAAHGFARGKSIVSNAQLHVSHRAVFNLDLKDFFPTINFGRVRGLFMKLPFGASPPIATILAQICCHEGSLPQGAPTSPVVSNMICSRLDAQLTRLARNFGCIYSRYADDLTFSKRKGMLPPEITVENGDGAFVPGKDVREVIEKNGFQIHPDKVHLYRNTTRQSVTGLTVNTGVNVERSFIRAIRAMICDWRKRGLDAAQATHHQKYYRHPSRMASKPPLPQIIHGKLDFLKMVVGIENPVRRNLQRQFVAQYPEYQTILEKENRQLKMHDLFISHASEDKIDFVRPLVTALLAEGVSVWYDETALTIGDDLLAKINDGLAKSRYGVVVLSPNFFNIKKKWPDREVSGLFALEDSDGTSRVLPIWHNVGQKEVAARNAILAGKFAWKSSEFTPAELAAKFREFMKTRR